MVGRSLDKNNLDFLRVKSNVTLPFITLTAGAGGIKGSWVEITSSSTLDVNYVLVILNEANVGTEYFVDIGIGGSGSEIVYIEDIQYHVNVTGNNNVTVTYPFKTEIPKNSRVALRVANTDNSDTIKVSIVAQGL